VPWILVDVAVALLALLALGLVAFFLYRRTRELARAVGTAGERIAEITSELDAVQSQAASRR
jgi:hypothetical protein